MLKKTTKTLYSIVIISLFLTLTVRLAWAADEPYKLLAPIGNLEEVSTEEGGFSIYLQRIIDISIGVTAAISVLILIMGGVQYVLSSVNEAAKKDAKERITNAIFGLLIALSGYLILNTINPDLLNLGLPVIQPLPSSSGSSPTGAPPPPRTN
jgi:uncharacterized membrane protein